MSLIDCMMAPCVLMEKKRTAGTEGGFRVQWEEGAAFNAAIVLDQSMQSRIAEKEGVTSVFTVTTKRDTLLEYHDVFKRVSDGAIFRVTSNGVDKQSPGFGTLDISQVTAERWELTT